MLPANRKNGQKGERGWSTLGGGEGKQGEAVGEWAEGTGEGKSGIGRPRRRIAGGWRVSGRVEMGQIRRNSRLGHLLLVLAEQIFRRLHRRAPASCCASARLPLMTRLHSFLTVDESCFSSLPAFPSIWLQIPPPLPLHAACCLPVPMSFPILDTHASAPGIPHACGSCL
jgi:hypothetical protein